MSPAVDTGVMLALVEVKIDGVAVNEHLIQEVRVQDSLALPTAFSITFSPRELSRGVDPLGVEGVDPSIGAKIEIFLGAPRDKQRQKLFDGELTALEPNFGPEGIRLVASGYDSSHRLHRGRKTRTFQKMTTSNIVKKLAPGGGADRQGLGYGCPARVRAAEQRDRLGVHPAHGLDERLRGRRRRHDPRVPRDPERRRTAPGARVRRELQQRGCAAAFLLPARHGGAAGEGSARPLVGPEGRRKRSRPRWP